MADVYEDTIAAVSTAMAPGGIGIVRISGKEAFSIADKGIPSITAGLRKTDRRLMRFWLLYSAIPIPIQEKIRWK